MAAALQEGDLFAGRYRIVRELASGGMGAVYEVIHTVTERRCALKVMLAHTVEREQLRKRFMQESRLAAQIGSEYIVDVLDAGVDDETKAPYLVMELLEGEDLGQRLLRFGPLSGEEGVSYLWHVALALDRTHQAGIVHRDLKASNLFLTRREDGTPLVKVLDFGVAKVLTLERSGGEQRTQTVGTPIYMAPEQFRAEGRISPATDIYALGMLAYTLLVGVHYWTEEHERCENPFAFASIAVNGPKEAPSLRSAREGVSLPEAFDTWFAKATSRWPQDRFPSATSAITELALALGIDAPAIPLSAPISGTVAAGSQSYERPPTPIGLAATLDAPSARLTQTGGSNATARARTPSIGSARIPTGGSQPSGGGREQHTEVSLSVTSGGVPLQPAEQPEPQSKARGIVIAALFAAVVVAIGVARSLNPPAPVIRELGAKPAPSGSAAGLASATPARPAPPEEKRDDELGVTPIDQLPRVAPDPVPTPAADDSNRRSTSPSRKQRTERRPSRNTQSTPAAAAPETTPQPKPVDRNLLYGRD